MMIQFSCRTTRLLMTRRGPRFMLKDDGNMGEGIFWVVASVLTATLNLLAVFALIRAKSYKSPYFIIMLALLIADSFAAIVVFPLRAAEQLINNAPCQLTFASRLSTNFIFLTSAIFIGMLACDRYLRVSLEHRYKEKVTRKRIFVAIIMSAIFGIGFSLAGMAWDLRLVLGFIVIEIVVAVLFFYYNLTQRLKELRSSGGTSTFISLSHQKRLRRSIRMIMMLLIVTFVIWLPGMVVTASPSSRATRAWRRSSYVVKLLPKLIILSSLTDPIFYFWMNREARRTILHVIGTDNSAGDTASTSVQRQHIFTTTTYRR